MSLLINDTVSEITIENNETLTEENQEEIQTVEFIEELIEEKSN